MPWLCFTVFKSILVPFFLKKPGLMVPSLFILSVFSEAQYALRAWGSCTQKVPMPFCFPRTLESPSVVQIPAALDAVGVLLYFVADCTTSQGTPWGKGFLLWHCLHVVEHSAVSIYGGVSGGILRLARIVGQNGISVVVPLSLRKERDESSGCLFDC